ncbi:MULTISPECIES: hypothetical protein [Sinorhizobium]|nr:MULTISPECIES: hypothetical protein [Sinorhizobium]
MGRPELPAHLLQVILAADSMPLPLSFHPVNGAVSLVLLAQVERHRLG